MDTHQRFEIMWLRNTYGVTLSGFDCNIWSSGLFSCRPYGLELSSRYYQSLSNQCRLFQTFTLNVFVCSTGYASQHIWCLSQARINWEGCARKGIWHQLVWMGWQSVRIVGASVCVIFILHQKIQKMAKCTFWFQLNRVVPDKVQRSVKRLCVFVCSILVHLAHKAFLTMTAV